MKMKDLLAMTKERGLDVTERTVRYYVSEGLLDKPEYPFPNQAIYSDMHLQKLILIHNYKQQGHSLEYIEHLLKEDFMWFNESGMLMDKAERDHEWQNLTRPGNATLYSHRDLLDLVKPEVLFMAIKLEVIPIKDKYDKLDLHVLKCMGYCASYFETIGYTEKAPDTEQNTVFENLSEVAKKLDHLARDIVAQTKSVESGWQKTALLESLVLLRARRVVIEGSYDNISWANGPVVLPPTRLPDEPSSPYWRDLFAALHSAGVDLVDFIASVDEPGRASLLEQPVMTADEADRYSDYADFVEAITNEGVVDKYRLRERARAVIKSVADKSNKDDPTKSP